MECVRKLCEEIDTDFDDRLDLEEIQSYVQLKQLPIDESTVTKMFEDAILGRGFVNDT